MSNHNEVYAIAQKIWEAGKDFENKEQWALRYDENPPTAYPIITPLVQELTDYLDQQIREERRTCANIAITATTGPWLHDDQQAAGVAIAKWILTRSIPLPYDGEDGG